MRRTRHGLKVFGLAIMAAAALTAFMAAGAQAAWLVGAPGTELGAGTSKEVIVEQHEKHGWLLVPSKGPLEILCTTIESLDALIKPAVEVKAELHFRGCETFLNGALQKNCKPEEPLTAKGEGALFLANSEVLLLLKPLSGETKFARVDFPVGCALTDTNVSGTLVLECLNPSLSATGSCLDHELTHLLKEFKLTGHGLLYGVNEAFLDGVAKAKLASDENWSGHI